MAWTTPATQTTGTLITASKWNEQITNNLAALHDPATDSYVGNEGADWTTTSVSFVDIDGTDLSLSITTTGGDVLVGFHGNLASGANTFLDVTMDGVAVAGDDGIIAIQGAGSTAPGRPVAFTRLITGVSAAAHTFNLRWKVASGTSTLYGGAGTANADLHPQFWVREVS